MASDGDEDMEQYDGDVGYDEEDIYVRDEVEENDGGMDYDQEDGENIADVEPIAVEERTPAAKVPSPRKIIPKGKGPSLFADSDEDEEDEEFDGGDSGGPSATDIPESNGATHTKAPTDPSPHTNGTHAPTEMDIDEPEDPTYQSDEEDEIIKEVDVFFSRKLAESLYIFQYPTRPHAFTDDYHPVAGRFKSRAQQVELDIPLQTRGPHYSRKKGEEFGEGTHDRPIATATEMRRDDPGDAILTKQTLSSSLLPSHAKYMVGMFTEGELHLTPVKAALQLRPSLQYIDKINEKHKATSQRANAELKKEEDPSYEDEGKLLQVTMRSAEDKEGARKAAQAELMRKMEEEPWTPMDIQGVESEESRNMAFELLSDTRDALDSKTDGDQYLDDIHPKIVTAQNKKDEKITVRRGIPVGDMGVLPLVDQLKALLLNAHIASFKAMTELLHVGHNEEDIIAKLPSVGVLVNGAWVVRSEIMYTGRALEARRHLLSMFHEQQTVSRWDFAEYVKLSPEMCKNMLNEIAYLGADKRWNLKVEADHEFMSSYPDVVDAQVKMVLEEAASARDALEAVKREVKQENTGPLTSRGPVNGGPSNGRPSSAKSAAAKKAAAKGASPEEQLKSFIEDLFKENAVCSWKFVNSRIAARIAEKDKDNLITADTASARKVENIIEGMCIKITDVYALTAVGDTTTDKYRPAVCELFRTKKTVKKADVMKACKDKTGEEPGLGPYKKLMSGLATNQGYSWTLKESP